MASAASTAKSQRRGLVIQPGEHWLIGGMTGSGKTYLVTSLVDRLQTLWRVPAIFVDSKGGEFDHLEGYDGVAFYRQDEPPPWPLPDGVNVAVWSPEKDDLAAYGRLFTRVKEARRKCVVVIDELSSMGKESADTFTPALPILLKQGRALGITLFVLTQELAYIPRSVLRQTTHLVLMMFDPADPDDFDTKRAYRLGGLPPVTRKRAFNYRSRSEPEKRWTYTDIQHFLGSSKARRKRR